MVDASSSSRPAVSPVASVSVSGRLDPLSLLPGRILDARVAAFLNDGAVRLDFAGGSLSARAGFPLALGMEVRLQVQADGMTLKLLLPESARPAGSAGQPAGPSGTPAPAAPVPGLSANPSAIALFAALGNTAALRQAPPAPEAVVRAAAGLAASVRPPVTPGEAAPRPAAAQAPAPALPSPSAPSARAVLAGLLNSLADAATAAEAPLPEAPRQAAARLLDLPLPPRASPLPAAAASSAPVHTGSPGSAPASQAVAIVAPLLASLARAVADTDGPVADFMRAAAARLLDTQPMAATGTRPLPAPMGAARAGLVPLLEAARAPAGAQTDQPVAVRAALARIAALAAPVADAADPEFLRQAMARAGLGLETRLAAAAAGGVPVGADLKAALLVLRNVLQSWMGADLSDNETGHAPGPATTRPATPAPTAQTAQDAARQELARALLRHTEAALARLRVAQVAALPEPGDPATVRADRDGPVHHFEIPLNDGGRFLIAQFDVSRDGGGGQEEDGAAAWSVRLALDLDDPIGATQALVALRGGQVGVRFWAQRQETADLLRDHEDLLRALLAEAGLATGEIIVRTGPAPSPASGAQHLVDQRT